MIVLHAGSSGELEPCAQAIAIAFCADQVDEEPVIALAATVHENLRPSIQAVDYDVDASIIVEIAESCSSVSGRSGKSWTQGRRDVLECSVPVVLQQAIGQLVGELIDLFGIVQNRRV